MAELQSSLKEVRSKKIIAKMNHKLNSKNRVHKRNLQLSTLTEDLQEKGFDVNKESLRSRSKVRKSLMDIEGG